VRQSREAGDEGVRAREGMPVAEADRMSVRDDIIVGGSSDRSVAHARGGTADDFGSCEHILEGPISFIGLCRENALASFGRAWIGCVTREPGIGAKSLQRLLRRLARRFSLGEALAVELANEILRMSGVLGAAVRLEGAHLCVRIGGLRETEVGARAIILRGAYNRSPQLQQEFIAFCGWDVVV
jgi:GTP cyclohydrolase I